jgi:putative ABC transport system permease protein
VTPAYFSTLGIPLRRGRLFGLHDAARSEPVAIVSASLARREWADEDPLGQSVRVGGGLRTVVGVVSDVRHRGPLTERIDDDVYVPQTQAPSRWVFLTVHGRDVASRALAIRRLVREADPEIAVSQVRTMQQALAAHTAEPRTRTEWVIGLSALALVLALTGLFASTAYWVGQRSRELAMRQALGAARRQIVGLVLGRVLRLAGAGALLGLAAAAVASRILLAFLYGVAPLDPASYALAALATLSAALLTACGPAVRAARVEPATALRRS